MADTPAPAPGPDEPEERHEPDEAALPADSPAAGVLDDDLDDPPEPSEPG